MLSDDGKFIINTSAENAYIIPLQGNDSTTITFDSSNFVMGFGNSGDNYYFISHLAHVNEKVSYTTYHFTVYNKKKRTPIIQQQMPSSFIRTETSNNGQYIVCYSVFQPKEDTAFLYDLSTGKLVTSLTGNFTEIRFSPGSQFMLAVKQDGYCNTYNIQTGENRQDSIAPYTEYQILKNGTILNNSLAIPMKNHRRIVAPYQQVFGAQDSKLISIKNDAEINIYDYEHNTSTSRVFQHENEYTDCKISPNHHYLLTLARDNYLLKWNYQTGELVGSIPVGFDYNRSFYFNSDTTFVLLFGNAKGTEYNLRTLAPNYSFTTGGNNHLNYFLPSGYYFANKEDLRKYYFNYKGKLYNFSQFDLLFNRPDTLLSTLHIGNPSQVEKFKNAWAKRLAFTHPGVSHLTFDPENAPTITVLNERELPLMDSLTGKINIKIATHDNNNQLYSIKAWVNNCPLFTTGRHLIPNNNKKDYSTTLPIQLSEGRNKIDICCDNSTGMESLYKTIYIDYLPVHPIISHTYFIGIGVSNYKENRNHLNFAAKDIHDLDSLFRAKCSSITSYLFIDSLAEVDNIMKLRNQLKNIGVNDKVIFAFSGHGLMDGSDFYLATASCNFDNPKEKGLAFDSLNSLINSIPARKKLVLIDACNSGQVDKDSTVKEDRFAAAFAGEQKEEGRAFELMEDIFADITYNNGSIIISAARSTQYAQEGTHNGIFTQCLLEGANNNEADANKDGAIQVEEMKEYISNRVSKLTNNHQQPVARYENTEFNWVLW